MNITSAIAAELKRLVGLAGQQPTTVTVSGPNHVQLEVDFLAVDRMSCSLRELRLRVPSLVGAGTDTLKKWAETLCSRITYLLENIGPLEVDEDAGQVLIRSTPPDKQSDGTRFYEIVLESHANGNFSLRRYRVTKGDAGRKHVDIQTTHEVLEKLAGDLVASLPAVGKS